MPRATQTTRKPKAPSKTYRVKEAVPATKIADLWLGQHLAEQEAEALPIGEPQRLIRAVEPYVPLGVDEIVLNGPALDLQLLDRLDREVLAAFD